MDSKNILKKVQEQLGKKAGERQAEKEQLEKERRDLVTGVASDIANAIKPYLEGMAGRAEITKEAIKEALREVAINVPESQVNIPEIKVPAPQVTVNVPEVKIPAINVPQTQITYPDRMKVSMDEVDNMRPLPVMMMDVKGRPMQFSQGASGGKSDFFTIKDIRTSSGASIIDQNLGAMKITGDIQVTAQAGSTIALVNRDGDYYNGDNPMPVTFSAASVQPVSQVSGQAWSTEVTSIFGSTGTNVVNPDGRLKVELPTGSSGLTDTELRATAVPVSQVSGANWSVSVTDIFGSTGTGFYNLDNRLRVSNDIGDVFTTTTTSSVVNADNRVKVELPAQTVTVASITATTAANIVDSTGVAYSGSNPVPVTATLSGSLTSSVVVGDIPSGTADTGSAPVKMGGIARTTNPAIEADGDRITFSADDIGRQLMRPVQVRDLIVTAYVSVTNGTEATLLAASAGSYHDLIMLVGSNNSDAAVSVDIRNVTGGNIVHTLRIPANGTAGFAPSVPWPQDATGNNWTVDGPDETGRTLTFSGLFSREV